MTTTTKPVAKLDGSLLLARKGEAMPAVAANQHNNPALAWGAPAHPEDFQPQVVAHTPTPQPQPQSTPPSVKPVASARLRPDSFFAARGRGGPSIHAAMPRPSVRTESLRDPVSLTVRVEDETYLRLKYLAQSSGRSTQQVLDDALERHLSVNGVPRTRKLVVKPQ